MGTKFGPIVQCETDEMNTLIEFRCEILAFTLFRLMWGSCHFNRALNDEFSVIHMSVLIFSLFSQHENQI